MERVIPTQLPAMIETVLLPFRGKIVYDGIVSTFNVAFGPGSRRGFEDSLRTAKAAIVTPEGFPLAYEVMPGNTSDKTTLKGFLAKIEEQYGRAQRIWVMDRGIPTEEIWFFATLSG